MKLLSKGKPVISTKNGGANEIVSEENGLLIDIDNVDQFGKAMKHSNGKLSKIR